MPENKTEYLGGYALMQVKIERLRRLMEISPDKKEIYIKKTADAVKHRDKIEEDIENLKNPLECEVLSLKYLCGKSTGEIADMLHYSRRQIERITASAIENIKIS